MGVAMAGIKSKPKKGGGPSSVFCHSRCSNEFHVVCVFESWNQHVGKLDVASLSNYASSRNK